MGTFGGLGRYRVIRLTRNFSIAHKPPAMSNSRIRLERNATSSRETGRDLFGVHGLDGIGIVRRVADGIACLLCRRMGRRVVRFLVRAHYRIHCWPSGWCIWVIRRGSLGKSGGLAFLPVYSSSLRRPDRQRLHPSGRMVATPSVESRRDRFRLDRFAGEGRCHQ